MESSVPLPSPNSTLLAPSLSYATEIQSMMFGFGDCTNPLLETAKVIESIVQDQMKQILYKAVDVAELRESKVISVEELLFLMRKNPIKIQRLTKYLGVKDVILKNNSHLPENHDHVARVLRCRQFIKTFDTNGAILMAIDDPCLDTDRIERLKRLDKMSRDMSERRYVEFTKARQVNFIKNKLKNHQKFHDWLTKDCKDYLMDKKIDKVGIEVFCYLAYETVGQLVDMALIVRNDANSERLHPSPLSFNCHYPMVQLSTQIGVLGATDNLEESPLRKRLKSGNSVSNESTSRNEVMVKMNPIKPCHVYEVVQRLSHLQRPFSLYRKADVKHQKAEMGMPLIAI